MTDDNIINFPQPERDAQLAEAETEYATMAAALSHVFGMELTPTQAKAINIIVNGEAWVCAGITPTERNGKRGADFHVAVAGDQQVLEDASPHLEGVMLRAIERHRKSEDQAKPPGCLCQGFYRPPNCPIHGEKT